MTTRQMIRSCGFYSSNGKDFRKTLGFSYYLTARAFKKGREKFVNVKKFFNNKLVDERNFLENIEADDMRTYCERQTF